ncbi:MAG: DRTGG domain-containing protein [Oscillospiraceae bacterium]
MTAIQLAKLANFDIINEGNGNEKDIDGIFCCDLLSFAMANMKKNSVWISVISNINTIAVAMFTNVSCLIISHSIKISNDVLKKAKENNICVLSSKLQTFETSLIVHNLFA